MTPTLRLLLAALLLLLGGGSLYLFHPQQTSSPHSLPSPPATALSSSPIPVISSPTPIPPAPTLTPTPAPYATPIADFTARITKKKFGTYVTPQHSPIQPERFTGYHTGVDIEYGDVSTDVPVYAIAAGTVQLAEWVSGYGGVVAISHNLDGRHFFSLYGHLRPSSLPNVGLTVQKGQQLAVLGTAYSHETDGERRHLHFAIVTSQTLNLKGYVSTLTELHQDWLDPLTLY